MSVRRMSRSAKMVVVVVGWCGLLAGVSGVLAAGAWAQAPGAGSWSVQPVSLPSNSNGSDIPEPDVGYLSAVSCASASACSALGEGSNADIPPPNAAVIAEQWDGNSWSAFDPFGQNAQDFAVDGASCVSATTCFAVGAYLYQSAPSTAMVLSYDSSGWNFASAPSPNNSSLNGISCTSAQFCLAVGGVKNKPLAERWNGNRWRKLTIRKPHRGFLENVSCIGPTWCMAVGPAASGHQLGLAQRWNGSSWTALRTPTMRGSSGGTLTGISCVSASFCLAVGERKTAGSRRKTVLAESWNGSRWSVTPIPALPVSGGTSLERVSCATANTCAAVGPNVINHQVLIEWWNGTNWAFSPSPTLTNTSANLFDVSCVNNQPTPATGAPTWCEAVGYNSSSGALVAMSYH